MRINKKIRQKRREIKELVEDILEKLNEVKDFQDLEDFMPIFSNRVWEIEKIIKR